MNGAAGGQPDRGIRKNTVLEYDTRFSAQRHIILLYYLSKRNRTQHLFLRHYYEDYIRLFIFSVAVYET